MLELPSFIIKYASTYFYALDAMHSYYQSVSYCDWPCVQAFSFMIVQTDDSLGNLLDT